MSKRRRRGLAAVGLVLAAATVAFAVVTAWVARLLDDV